MITLNFTEEESKKLFFISDTHFFHENIIKYCDRRKWDASEFGQGPFTVDRMNEVIVERWNHAVPKGSTVFHLGDVALGNKIPPGILLALLRRLNGAHYLINGNHEKMAKSELVSKHWIKSYDMVQLRVKDSEIDDDQMITLCHYPMITWNHAFRGAWQLFGHVHGVEVTSNPNQIDVGVDAHGINGPVSYDKVKEIITVNNLKIKKR